jgi:endogenous inhibitor of DNA gyrase (YacG/DUF329 family)
MKLSITCPICHKSARLDNIQDWPDFPFCSSRCKLIDLGNWLGEAYHLPVFDSGENENSDENQNE